MNDLNNVYKNLKKQKRNKVIGITVIILAFIFMATVAIYFLGFDNVDSFMDNISKETTSYYNITENDFSFDIINNEGWVTQYNGNSKNITIPSKVNNVPVTHIKSIKNENVTTISIPKSIIYIENDAFYHLKNLTAVTGGENVSSIGDRAFKGCTNLKNITLHNQLYNIGEEAFCNTGFKEIVIPNTVNALNTRSFNSCKNLEEITISKSVYIIDKQCFKNCVKLKDVYCYVGTVSLEEEVFTNCHKDLTIHCLENSDMIDYCKQEKIPYINKLK